MLWGRSRVKYLQFLEEQEFKRLGKFLRMHGWIE